ncbi:MAG: ABC transporter permease [Bdellovibrio sp.]|jgi:putative ABC transport system permease protein
MRFFLRWIVREVQNDRGWVAIFLVSLSLGLFGFVGLESFRSALETNLRLNARNFLSADLAVSSRRLISEAELTQIREGLRIKSESHMTEFFSMAASDQASRLVQVKAIDDNYPLYGNLKLGSGRQIFKGGAGSLGEKPQAWVYPELLVQLGVNVGQEIKIGSQNFLIEDTVVDDSTQTFRLAGLAPKIYFSSKYLQSTGLIGFGTTSSDVHLFELVINSDDELEPMAKALEKKFQDPNLQFATPYDKAQDSVRALEYLLDYLGLVSLVGMALAMVGLAYLIQLFLARRLGTWSLLKTLGLTHNKAVLFLLLELTLLGAFATLLVLPLSQLLLPLLGNLLQELLPMTLQLTLSPRTVALGLALSVVLPFLIAWPLLAPLRKLNLKQILLDRELWVLKWSVTDLLRWIPALTVFFGLSVWVSHSWRTASYFLAALLVSAAIVLFIARFVLARLPRLGSHWTMKQVHRRLTRAPLRFGVVILALAFGTMLLVLLPQIRAGLSQELLSPSSVRLPSLFLFDVQDDQIGSVREFLTEQGTEAQNVSPLVRARILTVNDKAYERTGEKNELQSREEEAESRFRNRGVNLTVRSELSASEELVAGTTFTSEPGDMAQLSLEKRYADRLGLGIGDILNFDIQGVEIKGKVVNLRSVKWNTFQPNFFIAFQPGFLEDAPKTWLLSVPPISDEKKNHLQNGLVAKFSNVSIVDVSRVVQKILELSGQMSGALTAMAALSVFVGLFVLATVLSTEARTRLIEWNLYKVLGARQSQVLILFLIESLIVTLISVSLGALLGVLLSLTLMLVIFEVTFVPAFGAIALGVLFPAALSILLGFLLGRRLTRGDSASLLAEGRL